MPLRLVTARSRHHLHPPMLELCARPIAKTLEAPLLERLVSVALPSQHTTQAFVMMHDRKGDNQSRMIDAGAPQAAGQAPGGRTGRTCFPRRAGGRLSLHRRPSRDDEGTDS